MTEPNTSPTASNIILAIGIVWGLLTFLVGLAASFSIGHNDSAFSIVLLFTGLLGILPIAILAVWKPTLAAILLAICYVWSGFSFLLQSNTAEKDGLVRATLVVLLLAIPNAILLSGYSYIASVRKKAAASGDGQC